MGKVTCLFNQRPSQRCQCRLPCGREPGGRGFLAQHPGFQHPAESPLQIGMVRKGSVAHAYLKRGTLIFKETKGKGDPDCGKQALAPRASYLFGMSSIFLPPSHSPCTVCKRRFPGDGNVPFQSLLCRHVPTGSWAAQQDRRLTLNFSPFLRICI